MRIQLSKTRGGALASTLLIILFLTIFALTLANLATFDLRTVNRNGQKQMAFEAAQAGLDAVTAELTKDPTLGKSDEVFTATLSDGSSYRVTFDSSETTPFSANNLDSLTPEPIGYDGRNVPALHASLFSTGTSPSGETSVVECLIRLEALPYAVAGTGAVELNSTVVTGPNDAHVYSGQIGPNSLQFGGLGTVIDGDARSAGGVSVGGATISGIVEENMSPETLPELDIDFFRNDSAPGVTYLPGGTLAVPILTGEVYIDGPITFPLAVVLADATVFVEDDLTVNGALTGTGTIFVNGDTEFGVALDLSDASNRLTLFSKGDIRFTAPILPSIIQGVLFSQGNITSVGSLQVIGAVYAVEDAVAGKGNIEIGSLLTSTVTYVSESTAFASYWLAQGGEADAIRVFWRRLR